MLGLYSVIALVIASFSCWMLSGSPLPLALSVVTVVTGLVGKHFTKKSRISQLLVASVVALLAGLIEWHLFRSGQAMVMSAETPPTLHLAMSLLWLAMMLAILSPTEPFRSVVRIQLAAGIGGGILLAASAAGTILYDFRAWQVFPIAALPLTIFFKSLITSTGVKPRPHIGVFASLLLVITGILLGTVQGATFLSATFNGSNNDDEDVAPQRPTDIGSGSGGMDGASRKIPREGKIQFDHKIQLFVKPHDTTLLDHWSKRPLYFRTATLTRFESDEVISPLRSGLWLYDLDDGEEDAMVQLLPSRSNRDHSYSVFLKQKASLSIPLAADTQSIFTSAVYEFADNWYQLSPPKEKPLFRFTAQVKITNQAGAIRIETRLPKTSPYLSLPPSPLSSRVRALTRSFDQDNSLAEVQSFLKEEVKYSLSFSTPENLSPIENFIFGDRSGHCEHYAAATVLMLRTMGVPSRLAYGYTGGAVDEQKSLFAFRDSDFHTWSEVLTSDRGWVIFDTVPEVREAAPRIPEQAKVPAVNLSDYHNFSDFDITERAARPWLETGLDTMIEFLSLNFLTMIMIAAVLIGIALWLQLAKRKKLQQIRSSKQITPNAPRFPRYLEELQKLGSSRGSVHHRSMTWKEFEELLSKRSELIPEVSQAISYYYAVQFAGRERDTQMETALEQRFREWRLTMEEA